MLSKDPAISLNGRERLAPPRHSAVASMRSLLVAVLAVFTMMLGANARAATITVDSLAEFLDLGGRKRRAIREVV